MANNIIFLGTAGDSYVAGKKLASSGGIIIQTVDLQFHIDPGPGALINASENKVNLRATTAILVSNSNLLHSNDVNAVIDAMTYGGTDKTGVLVANKTVIKGTEEINPILTKFHSSCLEKVIAIEPGQRVGIENVEIKALPAVSKDPNALGFKFLLPDLTLVYSSDTKYTKEIVKEYKGADILILNVPHAGETKSEHSLNSEDAIKIITEVNPKLAILNHFGLDMYKADILFEGRHIQKRTGVQTIMAKDGMSLSPTAYSAKSEQKRLSTFKDQETGEIKEEPVADKQKTLED